MTKEIQPDAYTPPPILSNSPKHDLKKDYEPLEGGCTLPNLINKLLKKPLSIVYELEMKNNVGKITCLLLLIATMSFSVFGIVVGTFSWDGVVRRADRQRLVLWSALGARGRLRRADEVLDGAAHLVGPRLGSVRLPALHQQEVAHARLERLDRAHAHADGMSAIKCNRV